MKLRHPNITFVYDAFEFRDTFYLIIERCEQTIYELIETPHIDGEEWLPVAAHSVLQGIAFIHKEGYIHKDIHPRNVFSSLIRDKMVPTKDPVTVFKIGKQVDMYHAGLVFLSLLLGRIPTFTENDILDGRPRNMAEELKSVYSPARGGERYPYPSFRF